MLEVHPEIHAQEHTEHRKVSTCHRCHRSFRAKNEDQFCVQLCSDCFDKHLNLREPMISVRVKARPQGQAHHSPSQTRTAR